MHDQPRTTVGRAKSSGMIAIEKRTTAMTSRGDPIAAGARRRLIPSTTSRLKMLLPRMLPTEMAPSPFAAATTDVASSGREVPTATTETPMTNAGIPRASANATAPSTTSCAPMMTAASPRQMWRAQSSRVT